jgi:hypothetical protein
MEALQKGYVRAIAAASGSVIVGEPETDEGVDLQLSHRLVSHGIDVRLEIQLKSTTSPIGENAISIQMKRDRYNYFRTPDPTVPRIIVIMSVPTEQDKWVQASGERLRIHHASYWVNLDGLPEATVANPTVSAPRTQVFDDIALCGIMERIGRGERP